MKQDVASFLDHVHSSSANTTFSLEKQCQLHGDPAFLEGPSSHMVYTWAQSSCMRTGLDFEYILCPCINTLGTFWGKPRTNPHPPTNLGRCCLLFPTLYGLGFRFQSSCVIAHYFNGWLLLEPPTSVVGDFCKKNIALLGPTTKTHPAIEMVFNIDFNSPRALMLQDLFSGVIQHHQLVWFRALGFRAWGLSKGWPGKYFCKRDHSADHRSLLGLGVFRVLNRVCEHSSTQ